MREYMQKYPGKLDERGEWESGESFPLAMHYHSCMRANCVDVL